MTWKEKAIKASRQEGFLRRLFTNRVRTESDNGLHSLGFFIVRKEEEEEEKERVEGGKGRGEGGGKERGTEEEREEGGFSFQLVIYGFSPGFFEILKIALSPAPASPPRPRGTCRGPGWAAPPDLQPEPEGTRSGENQSVAFSVFCPGDFCLLAVVQ